MNLELSQSRADAVLEALQSRRIPVAEFESIGFGEARPIADNATETGREANRRIEFTLIIPAGAPTIPAADGLPGDAVPGVPGLPPAEPAVGTGYIPPATPITPVSPQFRPGSATPLAGVDAGPAE